MRRRVQGWLVVALMGLSLSEYAGAAPANDRETARRLFEEAASLEAAEKWSEAIPKLRSALELAQTPGLEYHLAYCLEQQGELTQALAHYARAQELIAAGARAPDVEQLLATRQAALQARVPKITVVLPTNPPPDSFQVDGEERPLDNRDEPLIVDAGAHRIELRAASSKLAVVREVTIQEGQHLSLQLAWPPRPAERRAQPQQPARTLPAREPPRDQSSPVARTVLLIGSATLAVAGVGWGVAFTRASNMKAEEKDRLRAKTGGSKSACADREPAACDDLESAAKGEHKYRNLALGSFVAGGVFAAAAVGTWFIWKPSDDHSGRAVAFGVAPTAGGMRLGATGRF
jgi:tetratricopeptide (TPR) repeat protein